MPRFLVALVALFMIASQAAVAGSVITAKTFTPPGCSGPAVGDGVADDTAALQGDIDYAVNNQAALQIEPGTYMISKTLVIQTRKGNAITGLMISGLAGPNRNGSVKTGGVAILLSSGATDQPAVMSVGTGMFRDMIIQNIALISRVGKCATPYGLEFSSTGFSHVTLMNIASCNVGTAFAVLQNATSGEANGEAVDMLECTGAYDNCFYTNTSGQAFAHQMIDCGGTINNGGTCFKIGAASLGFGLNVFGGGFSLMPGPARNTYIENDGISGTLNVDGGRVEHCDTLLYYGGGSFGDTGMITVRGIEFTDYSGSYPLIDGTRNGFANAQWTNTFAYCKIEGRDSRYPMLSISPQAGDASETEFDHCLFLGFGNAVSDVMGPKAGITLTHCRFDTPQQRKYQKTP